MVPRYFDRTRAGRVRHGLQELRMVEDVENLCTKLQFRLLRNEEIFEDHKIEVIGPRPDEDVSTGSLAENSLDDYSLQAHSQTKVEHGAFFVAIFVSYNI